MAFVLLATGVSGCVTMTPHSNRPMNFHAGVAAGVSEGPDRFVVSVRSHQYTVLPSTGRPLFRALATRLDGEVGSRDGFRRVSIGAALAVDPQLADGRSGLYGAAGPVLNLYAFDPPQSRDDCCLNPGLKFVFGGRFLSGRGFSELEGELGRGPGVRLQIGFMLN